ncbi:MAG: hypothetical protein K2Q21_05690 [Chitinophagaceae bacterium]|nr:hypothetical protein [Chitinophagaceae bacterium]
MKKISLFVLCTTTLCWADAQILKAAHTEVITVNSTTSMTGYTRNITKVVLPEKTSAYVYRVTILPKGGRVADGSLLKVLSGLAGSSGLGAGISLMDYAIKSNDGNSVDAFIFNNPYDADYFYKKQDANWTACKAMPNRGNCCFYSGECLGREIYFGFKNNNIRQGLDVQLEVVAITDSSLVGTSRYSLTILNGTTGLVKYQVSSDMVNWQNFELRTGYQNTLDLSQNMAYCRIFTDNLKYVQYKVVPGERYKIVWNMQQLKLDLQRY